MHQAQPCYALKSVYNSPGLFYGWTRWRNGAPWVHRKGQKMSDSFVWFSLDDYDMLGFGAVVYVNTDKEPIWCSASLLIIF